MELVGTLAIVACLVGLLVWTSRRWGRPRFYVRGVVALWIVAVLLGVIVVVFALR